VELHVTAAIHCAAVQRMQLETSLFAATFHTPSTCDAMYYQIRRAVAKLSGANILSICELRDWNGRAIRAVQSRGGVWAFIDYSDGIIRPTHCSWPPPELAQKLFRSDKSQYFYPEDQPCLTQDLGHYSDLQSAHSEDAMVWSYFGAISYAPTEFRCLWAGWLLSLAGCKDSPVNCTVALWRRVPHPDNLTAGGPEIDAIVQTDRTVAFIEAKWRSGESRWQGLDGQTGQLELRSKFLQGVGHRIYGDRTLLLLSLTLDDRAGLPIESEGVRVVALLWKDLIRCSAHPLSEEIERYYDWKRNLIPRRKGFNAPG
jgi:hypothetical protein